MTPVAWLVRLAALRAAQAARHAAGAQARLADALAGVHAAEAEAEALAGRLARRRAVVRSAFLGAPRTRAALGDLVATLDSVFAAEASARQRIEDARKVVAIRREELAGAQRDLARARRAEDRRRHLHDRERAVARSRAEAFDEQEAADIRQALAGSAGESAA